MHTIFWKMLVQFLTKKQHYAPQLLPTGLSNDQTENSETHKIKKKTSSSSKDNSCNLLKEGQYQIGYWGQCQRSHHSSYSLGIRAVCILWAYQDRSLTRQSRRCQLTKATPLGMLSPPSSCLSLLDTPQFVYPVDITCITYTKMTIYTSIHAQWNHVLIYISYHITCLMATDGSKSESKWTKEKKKVGDSESIAMCLTRSM